MSRQNWIYISHFLNSDTPAYGNGEGLKIETDKSMNNGDSCNTLRLNLSNHIGTHIDFPKHFSLTGKSINDYKPDFWFFSKCRMVSVKVPENLLIDESIISTLEPDEYLELLFIKTGFETKRYTKEYWERNPGLAPSLAGHLKRLFPKLKAVGMDFISVSSFQNRMIGREAHKEYLIKNDILLIEDVKLSPIRSQDYFECIGLPLLLNEADGIQITLIANC